MILIYLEDRFSRAPAEITDDYLTSLSVVCPPPNALHYSGRQLQITCKALKVKVDRDDPVEEYKVSVDTVPPVFSAPVYFKPD